MQPGTLADWAGIVVVAVIALVPGLLAVGGLWLKVARLESDSRAKVSRELFDERQKHIDEKLNRIERMLMRALGIADTQP